MKRKDWDVDLYDRSNALFASLQVGYKDFLYINAGARKEWQYLWSGGTRESYDDVFIHRQVFRLFQPL